MRYFFLGDWRQNSGPSNVNRSLVENSDESMVYIHSRHRVLRKIESYKFLFYKIIVVSGGITKTNLKLCKLLRKKIIYVMHGCLRYENEVNKLNLSSEILNKEDEILEYASKIVAVSERYSFWLKDRYPQYKDKILFVNNGFTLKLRKLVNKEPFSIAITGGNRFQKNNGIVCQAVEFLKEKGISCVVYMFGQIKNNNEDLFQYEFVKPMGQLNKSEYYDKLDKISLMIVNSTLDTFGLVVTDALNCNCDLLMSKNVGAISVMDLTQDDVINNIFDVNEIADKIINLHNNGNSARLFKSIDQEKCSEKKAYLNLKRIIEKV